MMGTFLTTIVEGGQGSLRLRVEGRSRARGSVPQWLQDATRLNAQIYSGCTAVLINTPSLIEAKPDLFGQGDMFDDIPGPTSSAFELFHSSLLSAVEDIYENTNSPTYDDGLLRTFGKMASIFYANVETIALIPLTVSETSPMQQLHLTKTIMSNIKTMRLQLPSPRWATVVGVLNEIRSDNLTFRLVMPNGPLKGAVKQNRRKVLQDLWGKPVLAEGIVRFGNGDSPQHLDAEYIHLATDRDRDLFGRMPISLKSLPISAHKLHIQTPKSGVNAIKGSWPGKETDEEFEEMLGEVQQMRREAQ